MLGDKTHDATDHRHADADVDLFSDLFAKVGLTMGASRCAAPNVVSRENVQRKIVVMANVAGRDLGGVVGDIRAAAEREGVRRGAEERLLPILMTALAAGLALVPLALSAGSPGSQIQAPMAVVILFGLLSSTALNAFVLPALYLRFGSLSRDHSH